MLIQNIWNANNNNMLIIIHTINKKITKFNSPYAAYCDVIYCTVPFQNYDTFSACTFHISTGHHLYMLTYWI